VRLTHAPSDLRGVVLESRRWRHHEGELVIECRGLDGFGVFIPARWTDLPLAQGSDPEPSMGVIATPGGWRRLGEVLVGVRARRPGGARASRETAVTMSAQQLTLGLDDADLRRVWDARTTSDRDRKQLLRCLLDDVVVTVDRDQHQARIRLFWQAGAHTELTVALNRTSAKRTDTPEELVALIRRLAEHSPDAEIAMILARQGHRTATGLPFTAPRVAGIRERADIAASPRRAPTSDDGVSTRPSASSKPKTKSCDDGVSIHEAARQLGVCTQTIRRWLREGLLPAEQTAPHAPWRIKLSGDIRRRFIPDVPAGYVRLAEAAAQTGLARQTILNQIRRGDRDAIHVTQGQRRGLRVQLHPQEQGLLPAASADAR
jgi:transposase-like protein